MPLQKSRATFLLLPLELRLQIYKYMFLCKKPIMMDKNRQHRTERSLPLSVLRTCKQIHQEASPILYSQNIFALTWPDQICKWLTQIGRANIKLLKTIHILVLPKWNEEEEYFARTTGCWYKVLDLLAQEATGLRHILIYWSASFRPGDYGKDLRFVRELAKIQGLQSMVVDGFYGMHWPRYLTEKMGVTVVETNLINKRSPLRMRIWQEGTEDLIP